MSSSSTVFGRKKAKALGLQSDRFQHSSMSESAEKAMSDAKLRDRSSIDPNVWGKDGFSRIDTCARLLADCPDDILRLDYRLTTKE